MARMRIGGRRLSRGHLHPAHVMTGMRVGRSRRSGAHVVARVRVVSRGALGAFRTGAGLVRRLRSRRRGHVMTRMRIGGGRPGRNHLHPAHVMTSVRVGYSRRSRAHVVARVRINRRRRGGGRSRRDTARLGRCSARLGLWPHLRRTGGRSVGAVAAMPSMSLSDGRTGGQHERQDRDGGEQGAAHRAAPSSGRTVTTLNIPACMCISRWQWKAQSPGASAVRSKVTFDPGATLTVCFSG
ncbi:hypothetical protein D3C72_1539180 [compost metagenome]